MSTSDLPSSVFLTSGPRLPAIVDWLTGSVWSPDRYAALSREDYLRDGEKAVARVEELIALGAPRLWDELAARSHASPTPRAFLGLDEPLPPEQRRAVVIFDGLSLRELPLLLQLAGQTGFSVHSASVAATCLPTETIDFVAQRVLGPEATPGLGPSQLPAFGALASHHVHAAYLDNLNPRHTLPRDRHLLLWSSYPDRLYKDDASRFDTLFPQFHDQIPTLWKYTVQAIPAGMPIVVTSDHGYIFFGGTAESARESAATALLGEHRHKVFPADESFPPPHPDLQLVPERRLAMLRGRLKTYPKGVSSRRLYQHGGFSLMEVLVPWLELTRN